MTSKYSCDSVAAHSKYLAHKLGLSWEYSWELWMFVGWDKLPWPGLVELYDKLYPVVDSARSNLAPALCDDYG